MQTTAAPTHHRRDLAALGALLAVCLFPLLIKLIYYPQNIGSDDSYIHLQVARNIASGQGWGVNPGVSVNVSTSPLFTLIVALLDRLTANHAIFPAQAVSVLAAAFGLLLVYLRTRRDTRANWAALAAAFSLACSCDLWRWNGAVMEATLGFFWVALILYLFSDWRWTFPGCVLRGVVLALAVLTRPELVLALALCLFLMAVLGKNRWPSWIGLLLGIALPIVPWVVFCKRTFGNILPTTFYAKATNHLILWNPVIPRQFGLLIVEAFFWPALLLAAMLIVLRFRLPSPVLRKALLPAGLLLAVAAFYYLRTPALESVGRYLLPFLPCAGYLLGLVLPVAAGKLNRPAFRWLVGTALTLHLLTSLALNHIFIAPTMRAFQTEYKASMVAAAEYLAAHSSPATRVLVKSDIGVVSYTGDGRFFIADGGALASPELRGLSFTQQIAASRPQFVLHSFSAAPGDLAPLFPGLQPVWFHRFKQHGLEASLGMTSLVTNIYRVKSR